jgi:predicted RNase H-like HicB family nuclease
MAGAIRYRARGAREHFEDILDAADDGRPAIVVRGDRRVVAVDADRLVQLLTTVRPAEAQAVAENDGWSLFIPGLPVAADGATLDEAVEEMIDALRDYADAWIDRLRLAPNHADNWGLVQIVALASDARLRDWLLDERRGAETVRRGSAD